MGSPGRTVVADDADTFSIMPDAHYSTSGKSSSAENVPKDQKALADLDTFDYVGKSKAYVFDWNEFQYKNDIRWILHRVNIGTNVYEVIGRTAFVLHPLGTSQLDPAYLVKYGIDENAEEEARRGQDISEINILNIKKTFGSDSLFKNRASFFNYQDNNGAPTGKLPLSGTWGTTQDLLDAFFIANSGLSTSLTEEIGNFANEFFLCDSGASPREEKYIMNYEDTSGDAQKLELHRFYLPRFDDKKDSAIHPERRNGIYEPAAPNNETNFWDNLDINTKILLNPSTASPYNIGVDLLATDSTVDGIKWKDDALSDSFTADDYAIGRGIQWLANFGYDDEGNLLNDELKATFGNILLRRKQIAANLKDYCDSDDAPTSNIAPGTWDLVSNIPDYTGNEKTPYLNEFELKLIVNNTMEVISTTVGTVTTYKLRTRVEVDLALGSEIINIYDITSFSGTEATVGCELDADAANRQMTVKFDANSGNSGSVTFAQSPAGPYTIPIAYMTTTPNLHYAATSSILDTAYNMVTVETDSVNSEGNLPNKVLLNLELKINLGNALLKYNSNNVDYAKLNKMFRFHCTDLEFDRPVALDTPTLVSKTYILSTQVEDPRQNLNSGDWGIRPEANSLSDGQEAEINLTNGEQLVTKLGSTNDKSNPSAPSFAATDYDTGYDLEEVTSPSYINNSTFMSTAYIRNAPMLSPWELGFIHRGKKWQTLNLSKYNKSKAVKGYKNSNNNWFLPGGGKYEDGDANILDQIKMTPEAKSPVKVNLAGKSDEMLNALFAGIYLGCSPIMYGGSIDNISKSGTEITPEFISPIVSKLKAANFTTRAGIADILSFESENSGKRTKAGREELIGKVIQLTDIYSGLQMFELVILSQAIKDIGNPSDHTAAVKVKKPFYNSSGELETTDIDAYIGEINWDDSKGVIADEIIAQRKLRVRGYRKPSGEVQLISIKTLE